VNAAESVERGKNPEDGTGEGLAILVHHHGGSAAGAAKRGTRRRRVHLEKETQERRIPRPPNDSARSGGRNGQGARAATTRTNSVVEPNFTRGSPGTLVPGVRLDEEYPEADPNGEGGRARSQ